MVFSFHLFQDAVEGVEGLVHFVKHSVGNIDPLSLPIIPQQPQGENVVRGEDHDVAVVFFECVVLLSCQIRVKINALGAFVCGSHRSLISRSGILVEGAGDIIILVEN